MNIQKNDVSRKIDITDKIAEYGIQKRNIVGAFPETKGRYDLLSVIMICLPKKLAQADEGTRLHRLLGA